MEQRLTRLLSLDIKLLEMEAEQEMMDGIKICVIPDDFSHENQFVTNKG